VQPATAHPDVVKTPPISQPSRSLLFRAVIVIFIINLISSVIFIISINRPVYDDGFNMYDVHQYATRGISIETVRAQKNAPGPTSFIWMAMATRIFGGSELRDARIGALVSWLLLGVCLLWGASFSRSPELWYGALLALLVFPHSVEASCTVLTEGPAVFFACVGALAWIIYVEQSEAQISSLLCGIVAGLFLGLSITCRQYNLALLLAAALVPAVQSAVSRTPQPIRVRWLTGAMVSLCVSLLPVVILFFAWKGITNPSIESGSSYNGMYRASLGLNFVRPVIALSRISFYLFWLTFPAMFRVGSWRRWVLLALSGLSGVAAAHWHEALLEPGPLNTIVNAAGRIFNGPATALGLVTTLTSYNLMALLLILWERRDRFLASPVSLFSVLAVLAFIGEQFAVGGNIPFYDRYVMQIAPFLGVVAFTITASLDKLRLAVMIALSFFSHAVVWRYAIGH
jgi:hypothetical protein